MGTQHISYFNDLAQLGMADVQHNSLKGDVFVDVTIEGYRFKCQVGKFGPFVSSKSDYGSGDSYLGVSSINMAARNNCFDNDQRWHICKYHNQPHIDVSMLSDAGRRALSIETGIPIEGHRFDFSISELFYYSKAFSALRSWAKDHPRKIRTFKPNAYLGEWHAQAIIPDTVS